jgi:hypothetical protein
MTSIILQAFIAMDSYLALTTYVAEMQTKEACFNYKNMRVCVCQWVCVVPKTI